MFKDECIISDNTITDVVDGSKIVYDSNVKEFYYPYAKCENGKFFEDDHEIKLKYNYNLVCSLFQNTSENEELVEDCMEMIRQKNKNAFIKEISYSHDLNHDNVHPSYIILDSDDNLYQWSSVYRCSLRKKHVKFILPTYGNKIDFVFVDNKVVEVYSSYTKEFNISNILGIELIDHKYYAFNNYVVYEIGKCMCHSTPLSTEIYNISFYDKSKKTNYYSCKNGVLWTSPTTVEGLDRSDILDAWATSDGICIKCDDGHFYIHDAIFEEIDFYGNERFLRYENKKMCVVTHNDTKKPKILKKMFDVEILF